MGQASGYRSRASGAVRPALALIVAFSGFACAGEQAWDAHRASGQAGATKEAGTKTEAAQGSSTRASSSAGAIADVEQYRTSCRMQTHVFKESMSEAEAKDFTSRVTYMVQANLNGGDDKNLGDLLDEIGVPSYKGLCG
jgi:hypothetical protein